MIEFEEILKQTKAYKSIMSTKEAGNINHCIMIISEDEVACNSLCMLIARDLICNSDGCGTCKDCNLVEKKVHPALITLDDYKSQGLREFIERSYHVADGAKKIGLITNFEKIDIRKEQNRFLKLLEEPVDNTIFVIGVTKPTAVLETIKSRAFKVVLEAIDNDLLYNSLKTKYSEEEAKKAVEFAEGSITNAINILSSDKFLNCYNVMLDILCTLERSSTILNATKKIVINYAENNQRISSALNYLNAFEIIIKQVIEHHTKLKISNDEKILKIASLYNLATIINVEELIIETKKNITINCEIDNAFYNLFFKMLEVRYICR